MESKYDIRMVYGELNREIVYLQELRARDTAISPIISFVSLAISGLAFLVAVYSLNLGDASLMILAIAFSIVFMIALVATIRCWFRELAYERIFAKSLCSG